MTLQVCSLVLYRMTVVRTPRFHRDKTFDVANIIQSISFNENTIGEFHDALIHSVDAFYPLICAYRSKFA